MDREALLAQIATQKAQIAKTDYMIIDAFERFVNCETNSVYTIDRLSEWQKLWTLENELKKLDSEADNTNGNNRNSIFEELEDTKYMVVEAMEAWLCGRTPYYRKERLKIWWKLWNIPEEKAQMRNV